MLQLLPPLPCPSENWFNFVMRTHFRANQSSSADFVSVVRPVLFLVKSPRTGIWAVATFLDSRICSIFGSWRNYYGNVFLLRQVLRSGGRSRDKLRSLRQRASLISSSKMHSIMTHRYIHDL